MPSRQTQTVSSDLDGSYCPSHRGFLRDDAMMAGDYVALSDDDCDEEISGASAKNANFKTFQNCSLAVGILVGFFVQLTTLGANILVLEIWGGDFIETSRLEIIIFSVLWSLLTSSMALLILGFLRALMTAFFRSLPIADPVVGDLLEAIQEDMLEHMELRFVMGALVGVCFAWTVTDLFLGMVSQIGYSMLTLAISLFWCRAIMWFRTSDQVKYYSLEDDDHQDTMVANKTLTIV